ncbi:MAG: methyltransferase domain-containing protein [Bryobacterales bacterium]|nr:methyltransferase domain-containing protein [Bryobacterales bacterium]
MVEFTGERLVPGQVDQDLFNEHISRYAFASRLARNKRVLDIACGMGYGSAALAKVAASVVGLDLSQEAVTAARESYRESNLQFLAAPAQQIPFADHTFDLIVAFEVIEHLNDWSVLLLEAQRLLSPGGQFIVSTPNINYYAETRKTAGPNPYHQHEFQFEEFRTELTAVFPSVTLFLQNHVGAISFQPVSGSGILAAETATDRVTAEPEASHFFVAVCALTHQTGAPQYLYLPTATNVLREREQHIAKLETELAQKDSWLNELKKTHTELHTLHQEQGAELLKATEWALSLENDLKNTQQRNAELQIELQQQQDAALVTVAGYEGKIGALESELAERTEKALLLQRKLESELAAKVEELGACVDLLHKAESTVEERTVWAQHLQETIQHLQDTLTAAQGSRWLRLGRTFGIGPDFQNR